MKKNSVFLHVVILLFLSACNNSTPEQKAIQIISPLKDTTASAPLADTGPDSITFASADVVPARHRLGEAAWKEVVESRIGKKTFLLPDHLKGQKLVPVYMNGFVETLQDAYAEHRPLVLSPDDIWLVLCQGFSIHLNEHFKEYQSKVFTSDKKETLTVRNDSLDSGKAAPWQNLIAAFTKEAKGYLKQDLYTWMVPAFSTTDSTIHTVYEITLLESVQKAFNYVAESGCGIPTITLKGKIADWEDVERRAEHFREFGLGNWVDNLKPILHEFTEARKGHVNKKFWNGIYKESSAYGVHNISGWMLKFFPYMKIYVDGGTAKVPMGTETDENGKPAFYEQARETFRYVPNKWMNGDAYMLSTYTTRDFPGGFAKIQVQWTVYDPNHKRPARPERIEICGGFLGILQNHQNLSLRPLITWAVCKKEAPVLNNEYGTNDIKVEEIRRDNLIHQPDVWISDPMPHPLNKQWEDTTAERSISFGTQVPDSLPVYHPEAHTSYAQGIRELKSYLADTLKKGVFRGHKNPTGLHLRFAVTWEGTVACVEIKKESWTQAERDAITSLLLHLPYNWSPPSGSIRNDEGGLKRKVRMNALVVLDLTI